MRALQAHLLLEFRETFLEGSAFEHTFHISLDRLRLRAEIDTVNRQTPEDWRDRRIDERKLFTQEVRLGGKHLGTGRQAVTQFLARLGRGLCGG